MKVIYSIISLIFACVALLFPLSTFTVGAEELSPQYAVAESDEVWFYREPDEASGLFILPRTYYVLVLSRGERFCSARYLDDVEPFQSITGYVKTEKLTFVDFIPARPYLKKTISVTYTLPSRPNTVMGNGSFLQVEKKFVYYGASYLGTTRFHYVSSGGTFDYLPATEEISYEFNDDYLAVSTPPAVEQTPQEEPSSSISAGQIICICLCVAALIAISIPVLLGKKLPRAREEF